VEARDFDFAIKAVIMVKIFASSTIFGDGDRDDHQYDYAIIVVIIVLEVEGVGPDLIFTPFYLHRGTNPSSSCAALVSPKSQR